MHTCGNCGEFVSRDFVRVFGNEHNEVVGCPACMNMREVMQGEGAARRSQGVRWTRA
ncbi:hypothetical protein C453_05639 [Haloferax elongans ATCC BAA-1513]|uniref:Small CPxCG-related zinc finger protein n=1 Tax=Haloferax elongans ATCC BAA-1513 TaxID=1230453 RepID=M0HPU0_HALEO|nr:hypothetical protein [Haloferax elongans]ELZ86595.1 hypothetical protein C453_05639 [Haloferax elongans ATCC BAA-1513]